MNPELSALRDIHLPPATGWWPPAPGWWLLALVVLALIYGLLRYVRHRHARPDLDREAQAMLDAIQGRWEQDGDDARLAAELSALLRRVAISRFPGTEVAGLTGEAWLQWLDEQVGGKDFQQGAGRLLLEAAYRPRVSLENARALIDLVRNWLRQAGKEGSHA